jgi:ribose 5-phosphate isomerase A
MSERTTLTDDGAAALAAEALRHVASGQVVGLGTGHAATAFVRALGARVAAGLDVRGVPTSEATAALARGLGIKLLSPDDVETIDVAVDGADEIDPRADLIKGYGGALLREKIVAAASRQLVIVVDQEKLVPRLGDHTPVPVEVVQFGWQATAEALTKLGAAPVLRHATEDHAFITDGGNYILDCRFSRIADPRLLEQQIGMTVGVVESGLFIDRASAVIAATETGTEIFTRGTL